MKLAKSLKVRTFSAFLLLQLLSSVILLDYKSAVAVEGNPEIESSQITEIPEMQSESIDEVVKEIVTEPIVEEETEVEETKVEEDSAIDSEIEITEDEVTEDEVMEDSIEFIETAPQVQTFSARSAVANYKTVNYIATIYKGTNTIDSLPWGEPGFKQIGTTKSYVGTTVNVTKESSNGAYGYISIEGLGNGWVDLKALKVIDVVAANYYDYVTSGNYEIDSLPWGTVGFQKLGSTSQLLGNQVYVKYKTENGAYLYVEQNGKAIGWVDSKSLGLAGNKFTGIISNGNYNVDSLPWGTPGFKTLGLTNKYVGLELSVLGSTKNGSYY